MGKSLKAFQTDYIDLVLIHWPTPDIKSEGEHERLQTWSAMEDYKDLNSVRSIGVANFTKEHLEKMLPKI